MSRAGAAKESRNDFLGPATIVSIRVLTVKPTERFHAAGREPSRLALSLHGPERQSANDVALQEHHDRQHRNHAEDRQLAPAHALRSDQLRNGTGSVCTFILITRSHHHVYRTVPVPA
jgi:hypothetical protein